MSTNPSAFAGGGALSSIFGDSSDGAIVLDGVAACPFATLAANVYTTTRDGFCSALTINAGVTLKVAGTRVFVRGLLTGTGTIQANGNNAAGAVGGAATGNWTLNSGQAGAAGAVGAGTAGTNASPGLGGAGGGGGNSGATAGGGGGTGTAQGVSGNALHLPGPMLVGEFQGTAANRQLGGGAGGGSGAGDGAASGGGGGGGGGVVPVFASQITGSLTIQATGGNGAAGTGGNAGGGGGGGGGFIAIYTQSTPAGLTTSAAGGALGAGSGTGVAGTAGTAGTVVTQILN